MFGRDNKIYYYAFDDHVTNADYIGDNVLSTDGNGVPVTFDWEMPWADMNKRMDAKETKYIAMDTVGQGPFTLRAYVDNFYTHDGEDAPMLKMDFYGGNKGTGGYGNVPFGNAPFGGGRPSQDERLFAWTTKFKLVKLRFSGTTRKPLRFVSVSIAYVRKTIRR
jgi:hypothetical protein